MTDPQHWRRIESLFDEASRLPADERSGFLALAAADDESVRAEVTSLLAAMPDSDKKLRSVIGHAIDALGEPAQDAGRAVQRLGSEVEPGHVLDHRFAIEQFAGAGGMGTVYRALDRETGEHVAVKIVAAAEAGRFLREARLLADLAHPSIVRYVAHGTLPDGGRYLATEWLEGEDLASRLRAGRLSIEESLELARLAAAGLAAAHARGVVHRDIKPSNLFLVEGVRRVKLIDFGIAHAPLRTQALTLPGSVLGTAGYMAPEQASGDQIDTRADIFSLGCVLFECLTGEPAFPAKTVLGLLAGLLQGAVPRVRDLRPEVPEIVAALVARMVAKRAEDRPLDGAALAEELDAIELDAREAQPSPRSALTGSELRVVNALVVQSEQPIGEDLAMRARDAGGESIQLVDRTYLVTFAPSGSATERAARAAAWALAVSALRPDVRIAIATGRMENTARQPIGPAIDRAAELLGPRGVVLDELTAELLAARATIRDGQLVSLREVPAQARTLLGRPTPCVGRDKELGMLEATLAECQQESVARVALVTGPPGIGKSRVRHELVARVRANESARIIVASGDPVSAGSSLGLVRQLVRAAAGMRSGDPEHAQRQCLAAHLEPLFAADEVEPAIEFLGQLAGLPARLTDPPGAVGEWMRRSFEAWIAALCRQRPLLIVVEDLHWGDAPSVAYLSGALRRAADLPLVVLALARAEVHEVFPRLWAEAEPQELRLSGLPRRSAERLVRSVVPDIAPERLARIVQLAGGNPYYLEELLRSVVERGTDGLPDTVLAVIASVIDRQERDARRILRAASVFGATLWRGGVAALLGAQAADIDVAAWLDALSDREVLTRTSGTRFAGEVEYRFRHDLLREAAYAMLTEADRATAHRLAAEWLERAGEQDARMVAEHFEHGGEPARAIPWLLKAAVAAYDGHAWEAARELVERGVSHGASGELLGQLRRLQASTAIVVADWPMVAERSRSALALLPEPSPLRIRTAGIAMLAETFLGEHAAAARRAHDLVAASGAAAQTLHTGTGLGGACVASALLGRADLLASLLDVLERNAVDRNLDAWRHTVRRLASWLGARAPATDDIDAAELLAFYDQMGDANGQVFTGLFEALHEGEAAGSRTQAAFDAPRCVAERAQHLGFQDLVVMFRARAHMLAGAQAAALTAARSIRQTAWFRVHHIDAWLHLCRGELDLAATEAMLGRTHGLPLFRGLAAEVLARVELARGRPHEALGIAEAALAALQPLDQLGDASMLRLTRAESLDALGRRDEARAVLTEACERIARLADGFTEARLRTSYLEHVPANARTRELARLWR